MSKLKHPFDQNINFFEQYGKIDSALQKCMPDFFVISPPRSGSTWFFENLRRHPEIFIPPMKEVKYFSNYWNMCDINWYLGCFKEGSDKKKGDVSPSYAVLPDQIIRAIKNIAPNLRIIFIFRNPIERIWSHTKHQFRLKESVFAFSDYAYENIPDEKFIECLTDIGTTAYTDCLSIVKRWMARYSKENIYINFFDSIASKPQSLLEEAFQHISVSKDVDWSLFPLHERINQGLEQEVPTKFKEYLLSFHDKKIKEFADFLLDVFGLKIPESWNYIKNTDNKNKEIKPYRLYSSNDNNQIILKDILLRETILSTHVQLLKEDYKGFKIIAFKGECLAISKVLDGIDIIHTSKADLEKLKREGKIFSGETLNEVINLIATVEPGVTHGGNEAVRKELGAIRSGNEALQKEFSLIRGENKAFLKDLVAKSSRIEELQDELVKRDLTLQEQRKEIDGRDSNIETLQGEMATRDSRIGELQDELATRDSGLEALQDESAAKSSRIEALQNELAERDSRIEALQGEMATRDSRIGELQDELVKRDLTLQEQRKKNDDRDSNIETLQGEMATRDSRIEALQDELATRDSGLEALQDESAAKSSRIETLQDESAAKSSRIEALQNELAERDSRIEALQGEMAERKARTEEIQDELVARDTKIVALHGEMATRGSRIKKLQDEMTERDRRIEKLQGETTERGSKIEELLGELSDIKASPLSRLYKFIKGPEI